MTTAIDPVCGMQIEPPKAVGSSTHEGQTYYFCSGRCNANFEAAPEKYTAAQVPGPQGCCTATHSCR